MGYTYKIASTHIKMIKGKKGKYLVLLLIFASGVILSGAVSLVTFRFEKNKVKSLFDDAASYRFKYIEDATQNMLAALASFGDFYSASVPIERDGFNNFAQGVITRQPYIFECRWMPKVKAGERTEFELAARASGMANFFIKELDKAEQLIAASEKKEYFPVYYLSHSPLYVLNHDQVIGLNAASIPERWEAMQLARDTALPVIAEEIKQFEEPEISTASRIYIPIYRNNSAHQTLAERRQNLSGFVALLYRINKLIDYYLRGIPLEGVDIGIYNAASGRLLYSYPPSIRKGQINDSAALLNNKLTWSRILKVANQEWKIVCTTAPQFLAKHRIILPWVALGIGLLLTIILIFYLKAIISRAAIVESLVEKRTRELKEAQQRIEFILGATKTNIDVIDEDFNLLYVDSSWQNLYGDPQGKKCYAYFVSRDKVCPECGIKKAFETKQTVVSEEALPDKERNRPIQVTTVPFQDEKGKWLVAEVNVDISERKKIENELSRAKEELEIEAQGLIKANEDIKALNRELELKNEALKKIDQLKSDFVSIVSHELRTPLAIMKEGVSLVLDKVAGEIGEKAREILSMVFANTNRLNKLLNDMLDISKIEAGRVQLKKTPVDINSLVKETAEKWKIETDKREQGLSIHTGKEKINLYLDVDKIIQVLNNLISNAVKFTPAKGRIEINLQETKDNVEISVSDTGVGIPQEDLPKVFGKFQQFNRPVDNSSKGTGLGLAITKELVALHEGTINVESKVGKGTKLTFMLPKKDTEEVFHEHIYSGMKYVMERNTVLSLLSLRIPEFAALQQELGQEEAADFLKGIERIVNGFLRGKTDTIVRGSGELIVILPDVAKDGAKMVGRHVEEAMKNYLAGAKEESIRKISFDIGFAVYPDEAKTAEEVLSKARLK